MDQPRYLLTIYDGPFQVFALHHAVHPEVQALLAAYTSRVPAQGVRARYAELVRAAGSEEVLTGEALPDKVVTFFDTHLGAYGSSSVLELTGPTVFVENISRWSAYVLFDDPLVCGQESSTRAISRSDWPMAAEARDELCLVHLHDAWMEVFEKEFRVWTERFQDASWRNRFGLLDKEPFRPALDRARWALPGTIATHVSFSSHLRGRSRTLRVLKALGTQHGNPIQGRIAEELQRAYETLLPHMAKYAFREAVFSETAASEIPEHLLEMFLGSQRPLCASSEPVLTGPANPYPEGISSWPSRTTKRYLDPSMNAARAEVRCQASLAALTDLHRHRSWYPIWAAPKWAAGPYEISPAYGPEAVSEARVRTLMMEATNVFHTLQKEGRGSLAPLALPLGTDMTLKIPSVGFRDLDYSLLLRRDAVGANFEYRQLAGELYTLLQKKLPFHMRLQ